MPQIRKQASHLLLPIRPISQDHILALDSLRGLAALGIAFFHVYLWLHSLYGALDQKYPFLSELYKSVPFFAVLSGFLIYRSIRGLGSLEELRAYALRRFYRIYPLYAVSVVGYLSLSKFGQDPSSWTQRIIQELLMFPIFGNASYTYPAYWSLYTEELFYLSLPLWVLLTKSNPVRAALVAFAAFALVGSAVSDPIAMFKYFFTGILLCEFSRAKVAQKIPEWLALCIFFAGGALLYLDFTSGDFIGRLISSATEGFLSLDFERPFDSFRPTQHIYTLTLAVSYGLLLFASVKSKIISALFGFRPLRYLGAISYSIFIWNGLIISYGTSIRFHGIYPMVLPENPYLTNIDGSVVTFLGFYGAAILFYASISYVLIERPFLLLKRKTKTIEEPKGGIKLRKH